MTRTRDEESVLRARALYSSGMSAAEVGTVMGVPARTVSGWIEDPRPPVKLGRADVSDGQIRELAAGGVPVAEIARRLGASRGCVRGRLARMAKEDAA